MKDAVVRARVSRELKERAGAVLKAHDLELSDAIRLFLRQVVRRKGLPFEVRDASVRVASGKHLLSMKRKAQVRDRALIASGEISPESVVMIRPDQVRGAKIKWPDAPLTDE
jgi:addiction module RelB/DinJ family antitoxin